MSDASLDLKTPQKPAPAKPVKAAEPVAPAVAATLLQQKIHPSRFHLAEHRFAQHCIHPAHGTRYEQLFEPAYWAHVAKYLKPGDLVHVRPQDFSYAAVLMVRAAGPQAARVAEFVKKVDFDPVDTLAAVDGFEIQFADGVGWRIVRMKDKRIMRDTIETKEQAFTELGQNAKLWAA